MHKVKTAFASLFESNMIHMSSNETYTTHQSSQKSRTKPPSRCNTSKLRLLQSFRIVFGGGVSEASLTLKRDQVTWLWLHDPRHQIQGSPLVLSFPCPTNYVDKSKSNFNRFIGPDPGVINEIWGVRQRIMLCNTKCAYILLNVHMNILWLYSYNWAAGQSCAAEAHICKCGTKPECESAKIHLCIERQTPMEYLYVSWRMPCDSSGVSKWELAGGFTLFSWVGIKGTAPRTAPRRWPIPTPAHLEQRAHCVIFPLLSSSPAFHVLPSFSPPVLHSAPSAVAFPQCRYLAVLLVRPPLQPSPSSRFGFSNSGNEMFHYLHFTAFNRERI